MNFKMKKYPHPRSNIKKYNTKDRIRSAEETFSLGFTSTWSFHSPTLLATTCCEALMSVCTVIVNKPYV